MSIAALYDIHGNTLALEAVLREVEGRAPDEIVIGGDVAYGPSPDEVLRRLHSLRGRCRFVSGNADRHLVDVFDGVQPDPNTPTRVIESLSWCARRISANDRDFMAGFLTSVTITTRTAGEILFVHAAPNSDEAVFTDETPVEKIRHRFANVTADVVVCGHTHIQFDRHIDDIRVVNAGSVGKPFGEPGAYWLLIDDDGIHFHRTTYDTDRAAAAIRGSEFPEAARWSEEIRLPTNRDEAVAWHESRKKW